MKSIIAGNWKMNGSKSQIDEWFKLFFDSLKEYEASNSLKPEKIPDVLVCMPSIYLDYAQKVAGKYNKTSTSLKVFIGAEDCHYEDSGAFTGNTSPAFLEELGCKYTILGHSERRMYQGETDELIAKKAQKALEHGLTPMIGVGESLEVRESGKHFEHIEKQIVKSTEGVDVSKVVVAYEPIWAIGTGKVPSENDINEMCGFMKDTLVKAKGIDRSLLRAIYGGSVKSNNSKAILSLNNVNGVLVGGASLKGDEFFKIAVSAL